jgi:hypothetical protein
MPRTVAPCIVSKRSSDPRLMLLIRLDAATAAAAAGKPREAVRSMEEIQNDAQRRGLRPLEAEASIGLAELSAGNRDHAQTRKHAERAVAIAGKTESLVQLARANQILAASRRSAGDVEDGLKHLAEARRLADTIRREASDDRITGRRDLKALFADSDAR